MTMAFFLGQLRLIAVALIGYATGKGWLTPADATLAGQILPPIGALIGPWIWSIYANFNGKIVPKDSIAIARSNVMNADHAISSGVAIINSDSNKGEVPIAKVVG